MDSGPRITDSAAVQVPAGAGVGLIHFALAMGGFAIGTTEFATMSLLPYFGRDLGIDGGFRIAVQGGRGYGLRQLKPAGHQA